MLVAHSLLWHRQTDWGMLQ